MKDSRNLNIRQFDRKIIQDAVNTKSLEEFIFALNKVCKGVTQDKMIVAVFNDNDDDEVRGYAVVSQDEELRKSEKIETIDLETLFNRYYEI